MFTISIFLRILVGDVEKHIKLWMHLQKSSCHFDVSVTYRLRNNLIEHETMATKISELLYRDAILRSLKSVRHRVIRNRKHVADILCPLHHLHSRHRQRTCIAPFEVFGRTRSCRS